MKKLLLTLELEYDDELMYDTEDPDGKDWFYNFVLRDLDREGITLWSNHIGDDVGYVNVISITEMP